jgi:hypothetical protein
MQENVKIVPSFATNFTVYATPCVTLSPDGTGSAMVHEDWTDRTYGLEGQLVNVKPLVDSNDPWMKKSESVNVEAPSFLTIIVRLPGDPLLQLPLGHGQL